MIQESSAVISNSKLMSTAHLIELEAPSIMKVCKPGQFIMVRCGDEFVLRRPFSIHRTGNSDSLSILFNIVGRGTSWLEQIKEGEKLDVLGPLGNGFTVNYGTESSLLVAGGIGIAPLLYLANELLTANKSVTLVVGASGGDCLYPVELLPKGAHIVIATEDGSIGQKGMVTDLLSDYENQIQQVFACGPLAMYKTMFSCMNSAGLNSLTQVSLEVRMGCGVGACYGCSIKTRNGMKSVCKDGPVFFLDEIIWDEVKI